MNRFRPRGAFIALFAGFCAFLIFAHEGHARFSTPLAVLFVLAASVGVLDTFGTFDDAGAVANTNAIGALAKPIGAAVLAIVGHGVAIDLATTAVFGPIWAGIAVSLSFIAAIAAVFWVGVSAGPFAKDESGNPRPLWARHGFWLLAIGALVLLPTAGSHSLIDPWETHYGEVAREMIARDDWISTWWAQEGWFFSKPVWNFWMQAAAMSAFGVQWQAGRMLAPTASGHTPWPEWAVRVPVAWMALLATYLLYKAVARVFGRRAGLFAGLCVLGSADFALLSHQTMADMPFVAAMSSAMALVLLGIHTDADREAKTYEITLGKTSLKVSAFHLAALPVIALTLAQSLYLGTRNAIFVTSDGLPGFYAHRDTFWSGSAGNCGLAGNEVCRRWLPFLRWYQPSLEGLTWIAMLAAFLWVNRAERRLSRLCLHGAWLFAAIATLGKGPAGFLLPALCALTYVAVTGRFRELLRFEVLSGALILLGVAMPWYVAMYVRHGFPFIDRLIFHDMWERALAHVHDTNEGDDTSFRYYVWQLGYGLFPLTGLAPAALVAFATKRKTDGPRSDALVFLTMWFGFAFALFSLMGTKFHHYIFPAVPPAAALIGVLLDRFYEGPSRGPGRTLAFAGIPFAAALTGLAARDLVLRPPADVVGPARLLYLFTYNYQRPWPDSLDLSWPLGVFGAVAAIATLALIAPKIRRFAVPTVIAVALGFSIFCLDEYLPKTAPHWGQREIIEQYFQHRKNAEEPIASYELNWKGENFYTGNHIAVFGGGGGGQTLGPWVSEMRAKGVTHLFFVLEHRSISSLRRDLGSPPIFDVLTSKTVNNKFTLVMAGWDEGGLWSPP